MFQITMVLFRKIDSALGFHRTSCFFRKYGVVFLFVLQFDSKFYQSLICRFLKEKIIPSLIFYIFPLLCAVR